MNYNDGYISTFSNDEYKKALNDKEKLSKIRKVYLNRYCSCDENKSIEVKDILFKESLDHYVLKQLNNNPSFINSNEMINYLNHIINIYNVSNIEIYTNVVFRNEKIREMIFNKYLSKYKNQLNNTNDNIEKKVTIIREKIIKKQKITQQELDYICEFVAKSRVPELKINEELLEYIFGEMKNTNLKVSFQVQDAILAYLPYFYKNSHIKDARYVLGDTDKGKVISGPGHSAGQGNYLAINKKIFENVNLNSIEDSNVERLKRGSDITFFMIVMFHEITHQVQQTAANKKDFDNHGMGYIIKQILNKEYKDYFTNHDSDEIEIDANECGWEKSALFYKKFYSGSNKEKLYQNCLINKYSSDARRAFAYKKNKEDEFLPYADYDITNITQIIKNKPKYIQEYPMLKNFFQDNGNIDISYMYNNSIWTESIGIEFINFFYKNKGINTMMKHLDIKKFNTREVQNLMDNLWNFIHSNLEKIINLSYIVEHKSYGQYKNNEEFSPEVAKRLIKKYYKTAIESYKEVRPLLEKIVRLYPNQKQYLDFINDSMDKTLTGSFLRKYEENLNNSEDYIEGIKHR